MRNVGLLRFVYRAGGAVCLSPHPPLAPNEAVISREHDELAGRCFFFCSSAAKYEKWNRKTQLCQFAQTSVISCIRPSHLIRTQTDSEM